jgi:hypothetical protein
MPTPRPQFQITCRIAVTSEVATEPLTSGIFDLAPAPVPVAEVQHQLVDFQTIDCCSGSFGTSVQQQSGLGLPLARQSQRTTKEIS